MGVFKVKAHASIGFQFLKGKWMLKGEFGFKSMRNLKEKLNPFGKSGPKSRSNLDPPKRTNSKPPRDPRRGRAPSFWTTPLTAGMPSTGRRRGVTCFASSPPPWEAGSPPRLDSTVTDLRRQHGLDRWTPTDPEWPKWFFHSEGHFPRNLEIRWFLTIKQHLKGNIRKIIKDPPLWF